MFNRDEFGLEHGMSWSFRAMVLGTVGVVSFGAGLFYAMQAVAEDRVTDRIEFRQSAPRA